MKDRIKVNRCEFWGFEIWLFGSLFFLRPLIDCQTLHLPGTFSADVNGKWHYIYNSTTEKECKKTRRHLHPPSPSQYCSLYMRMITLLFWRLLVMRKLLLIMLWVYCFMAGSAAWQSRTDREGPTETQTCIGTTAVGRSKVFRTLVSKRSIPVEPCYFTVTGAQNIVCFTSSLFKSDC